MVHLWFPEFHLIIFFYIYRFFPNQFKWTSETHEVLWLNFPFFVSDVCVPRIYQSNGHWEPKAAEVALLIELIDTTMEKCLFTFWAIVFFSQFFVSFHVICYVPWSCKYFLAYFAGKLEKCVNNIHDYIKKTTWKQIENHVDSINVIKYMVE